MLFQQPSSSVPEDSAVVATPALQSVVTPEPGVGSLTVPALGAELVYVFNRMVEVALALSVEVPPGHREEIGRAHV